MQITIFRVEKTKDYTVMANDHLKNKDLSLKAKGLLSVILSLPENWNYSMNGLVAISKESIDGIRTALQELEKYKYIVRNRVRDENGQLRTLYSVYETRQNKKQEKELKQYIKNYEKAIKAKIAENRKQKNSPDGKIQCGKNVENKALLPHGKNQVGKTNVVKPHRKNQVGKAIGGNTKLVKPTQLNTNNKILKNKILKENTHLILSKEDEMRKEALFEDFKNKIELNSQFDYYKDKPMSLENLKDILNIIKDLYMLNDNQYITISGNKVYAKDIIKILNSYDYDTVQYVLESIKNNSADIKNIKAYTIATLYNAPKTINLYYSGKVNNDFKKTAEKKQMFATS